MGNFDLKGKTVVMTGASGGIGRETALEFASRGAVLVLSGRNVRELENTKLKVAAVGAEAHIVPADVRDREEVEELVKKAIELTGRLDVMYLGAGYGLMGEIEHVTMDMWEDLMRTNFWGVLYGFYAAVPHMIEQKSGQIIIMNSLTGKVSLPICTPYCTSKYALWGFTDGARAELAQHNVDLIGIYPYFVKTDFQKHTQSPDMKLRTNIANLMWGQKPENVAKAVVRASERRKGEYVGTILGKIGPRILPLSYYFTEYAKRIFYPFIRFILRSKNGTGK